MVGAIQILNASGFAGVLGIVDADFDNITGEPLPASNIFKTDLHDLECLLLSSPALGRVLDEFASREKLEAFVKQRGAGVGDYLAEQAKALGCLRLISLRLNWNLKFVDLRFKRFTDEENLTIDLTRLTIEVLNKSQKPKLRQEHPEEHVRADLAQNHNLWQICCGPDLVELLSFALCHALGGHNAMEVKPDILVRSLRLAYRDEYFATTALDAALRAWQDANPLCSLA